MLHWQLLILIGVLFLIIEIFTPVLFFLNFALACFLTAILGAFITSWNVLIPVFVVLSAIFLLFLRPFLIKSKNVDKQTGFEEKYIGKIATVTDTITSRSGVISIYNERWEARSNTDEEIPIASEVKIIRNESLILYVEKFN